METDLEYIPDISVIVCSYNHAKWIERCLRSITHQIHINKSDYEIILVDDGSEDDTCEVLSNIEDIKNLRIIQNKQNLGLPKSLNLAIRKARGRYIIRVDSDDYIARETLYFMKFFMDKNRHYQAVACDYQFVSSEEIPGERKDAMKEEIACGIMYRKECLFDIGLYSEEFRMREGHELRTRFLSKYTMAHLPIPFYKYRDHENNRTKNLEEVSKFDEKLNNQGK
ncbi:alpha-mannosidase [Halobacteriovorax marinus]|uniref:Alpha-mannosidase n=1 Tax=Halobacteriovorax marinus TaxID=97084 RepID=A0A1Y5FGK8_9BACT|nr:alpha-mannosidase [Halobacteriovorax marinus]